MNSSDQIIDIDNWTTQLRKGILELCLVNLLAGGEMYGYDVVKQMGRVKGLVITEGTVYPLLSRLRKAGLLTARLEESPNGPARKYYGLSRDGFRVKALMNAYWTDLAEGIARLRQESEGNHG